MSDASIPAPESGGNGQTKRRASRWPIVVIGLVMVAPVVASYFTYYVLKPQGRTNFGSLIDPQREVPALVARDLEGEPVELPSLKGQWLLVTVAGGACDAACESNLYLQRQLHEGLGKNKGRLDRVWLVDDEAVVPEKLRPGLAGTTVLRLQSDQISRWLQPEAGHKLPEHLYLVDPHGNWMMRFPPSLDKDTAVQVRRDLGRLMYASAGWDQPGRD